MKSLRIIIDGRMIGESGVGRYIKNLIEHLQVIDQKNSYFILLRKKEYDKLIFRKNFTKILADFRWYSFKEQVKLPGLLEAIKPDLVHFPHFNIPIFYKGNFVVTIHDLIHQHFSMQRATTHGPVFYKIKQLGYKKVFDIALKNSKKILVPSNFVKEQLVDDWKIIGDKIIVTYEAVDDSLFTIGNKLENKKTNSPYIFYVGNAHPHKNVEGLIKTFLILKKKYTNLKLILAGHDHYFWQRIKKEFQEKDIVYKGHISDEELVDLYKNAEAFVMPSFEEGFGIPILEAFALHCPVVSSNTGSLPEIGGDACLYFDPSSSDDMSKKISMLLDDEKLKRNLIEKGFKRCKEFNWQKLAKETLEVYLKCV